MVYRPGELDQLITIEREVNTPDGYGGNTISWQQINQVFALVRPMSGREITDYDRVNAEARYMFVVRFPVDIVDSDRIVWDGEIFNIRVRHRPKTRDLYMKIEAERGVAQ